MRDIVLYFVVVSLYHRRVPPLHARALTAGGVISRPIAERFASFFRTQESLDTLCKRYDVPEETATLLTTYATPDSTPARDSVVLGWYKFCTWRDDYRRRPYGTVQAAGALTTDAQPFRSISVSHDDDEEEDGIAHLGRQQRRQGLEERDRAVADGGRRPDGEMANDDRVKGRIPRAGSRWPIDCNGSFPFLEEHRLLFTSDEGLDTTKLLDEKGRTNLTMMLYIFVHPMRDTVLCFVVVSQAARSSGGNKSWSTGPHVTRRRASAMPLLSKPFVSPHCRSLLAATLFFLLPCDRADQSRAHSKPPSTDWPPETLRTCAAFLDGSPQLTGHDHEVGCLT
nr:unnamed protein product [Digitaria exilis]